MSRHLMVVMEKRGARHEATATIYMPDSFDEPYRPSEYSAEELRWSVRRGVALQALALSELDRRGELGQTG